ncbi:uncharacterized protein LOC100838964 [Brachypodium distachyon]|uniref:uncharacterized protein LOC100838964 n=1 Tax=Brachypodium distachyon TaxID=15368 RepID=UPI00052FF5A7|nr:uncharacterized protein LOC100838964 [Brachypodium distachyon]|eukprot:XP_024314750.1 uncharacterized protein LOC100838964 [Brachypodium distachyon]
MPSRKPGTEIRGHWTDGETWALVDAWGPLYLRRGGRSLSVDDWRVVSSAVNAHRAAAGCTLKDQYKKELYKQGPSRWRHFSQLSAFLASPDAPPPGFSAKVTPATTTVKKEKEEEEKEEVGPPPGFLYKMAAATVKEEEQEVVGCGCELVGRKRPRNLAAGEGGCQCPAAVVTKLAEVYERVAMAALGVEKEKMEMQRKNLGAVKVEIMEEVDDKPAE